MEYTDEYDIFSPQGSEENMGSNEMYTIRNCVIISIVKLAFWETREGDIKDQRLFLEVYFKRTPMGKCLSD